MEIALAGVNDGLSGLMPMRLTYGAIQGSDRLRDAISGLYAGRSRDDVLVTHGAIGANALIYQAMVEPGDRVVAITPNYQQHYSIPESLGAEVVRLELEQENGFLPDLDRLIWWRLHGVPVLGSCAMRFIAGPSRRGRGSRPLLQIFMSVELRRALCPRRFRWLGCGWDGWWLRLRCWRLPWCIGITIRSRSGRLTIIWRHWRWRMRIRYWSVAAAFDAIG